MFVCVCGVCVSLSAQPQVTLTQQQSCYNHKIVTSVFKFNPDKRKTTTRLVQKYNTLTVESYTTVYNQNKNNTQFQALERLINGKIKWNGCDSTDTVIAQLFFPLVTIQI